MSDMPGCEGSRLLVMDPDQPQLCHAQCQQGSQNVSPTPTSDAPASPVLWAVLDWAARAIVPAPGMLPASRATPVTTGASPPGAPPLYLRLLVLRY